MADRTHVEVSPETREWLESGDRLILLSLLHRHIRYFGELMHDLAESPRSIKELLESAQANFELPWTTVDPVRRRVSWLISLGYVEYCTASRLRLSEEGEKVYASLSPGGPELRQEKPQQWTEINLPSPPTKLATLLDGLDPVTLQSRIAVLGYIPRGNLDIDIIAALHLLINATSPQVSRADLLAFTQEQFEVSESSFTAVLTMLTRTGLVQQTSLNVFSPTPVASEWLENPTPESLILLLHCKVQFILEIIPLLSEYDKAPAIARAAHQHFSLPRVDVAGIRARLQLLKAAGLVEEYSNWKYRPTALGEAFIHTYSFQKPADDDDNVHDPGLDEKLSDYDKALPSRFSETQAIISELLESATDSDSPSRLEKAVAESLSLLGFEARHVGGGGKTDVLATVVDPSGNEVRVIVDAKSARSGTVTEGAVSFDTLREHKRQHKADFVILVGPSFDSGRTRTRAAEHGVRLVTVEELTRVLARHSRVPQSAFAYLKLVDPDQESLTDFESKWLKLERKLFLLGHVSAVLAQEAQQGDQTTGGALTTDQIYLIIRDEIDPRPTAKDIEEVVKFLEHPLIGSVTHNSSTNKIPSYRLIDSPQRVADKIRSIADAVEQVEVDE